MKSKIKQSSTPSSPRPTDVVDPWAQWINAAVSVGMAFWRYEQLLIGMPVPQADRLSLVEPTAATAPRLTLAHSNAVVVVRADAAQRPRLHLVSTVLRLRRGHD